MQKQKDKHIKVGYNTKQNFDKLQADLKYSGCFKTKSELIDILIDSFKSKNKELEEINKNE